MTPTAFGTAPAVMSAYKGVNLLGEGWCGNTGLFVCKRVPASLSTLRRGSLLL